MPNVQSSMLYNFNGYANNAADPPVIAKRPCGISWAAKMMEPLVLSTNADTVQTTGVAALRPLKPKDAYNSAGPYYFAGDHVTNATKAGLVGFAVEPWSADASGVANQQTYAVAASIKSPQAQPILTMPSIPFSLQHYPPSPTVDAAYLGSEAAFARCDMGNIFWTNQILAGTVNGTATGVTMSAAYVGAAASLVYNATTGLWMVAVATATVTTAMISTGTYTFSSTYAPLVIDAYDPYFGYVYFHVVDAYNQLLNASPYTVAYTTGSE